MPEIVNVEQAAAWDGPSGDAWVAREAAQNEALRRHSERLLEVAAVRHDRPRARRRLRHGRHHARVRAAGRRR